MGKWYNSTTPQSRIPSELNLFKEVTTRVRPMQSTRRMLLQWQVAVTSKQIFTCRHLYTMIKIWLCRRQSSDADTSNSETRNSGIFHEPNLKAPRRPKGFMIKEIKAYFIKLLGMDYITVSSKCPNVITIRGRRCADTGPQK